MGEADWRDVQNTMQNSVGDFNDVEMIGHSKTVLLWGKLYGCVMKSCEGSSGGRFV